MAIFRRHERQPVAQWSLVACGCKRELLGHVRGNQAQASELLGIARSTLRTKISDLGLTFEKRLKVSSNLDD